MSDFYQINNPIILFDGVCNLCNSTVQFIIKHDKKSLFRFASLQSETGQKILQDFKQDTSDFTSFILFADNTIYTRSTAALMVAKQLSSPWWLLYSLMIIPAFIRNSIYNFIAKRRYQWFGRTETCQLPDRRINSCFF
jgi:predicted DCC family thiol-disulfide oxidoreductase YuxK